jgi:hypothetical protein
MLSSAVAAKSWDAAVLAEGPWGHLAMLLGKWQTCSDEFRATGAAIL